MTTIDLFDLDLDAPPPEPAIWPTAELQARCEAAGYSEGDLRKLFGIHVKWRLRRRATGRLVDEICARVLNIHPTVIYGRDWSENPWAG